MEESTSDKRKTTVQQKGAYTKKAKKKTKQNKRTEKTKQKQRMRSGRRPSEGTRLKVAICWHNQSYHLSYVCPAGVPTANGRNTKIIDVRPKEGREKEPKRNEQSYQVLRVSPMSSWWVLLYVGGDFICRMKAFLQGG